MQGDVNYKQLTNSFTNSQLTISDIPRSAEEFKQMGYAQRLELSKKRPATYEFWLNATKEGGKNWC